MSDPFDITNFDGILNSASEGKVAMLSGTYDQILGSLTATLLTSYMLKFNPLIVKKVSDDSAVPSFDALYSLLTSAPLSDVLSNLRTHVFAGDDDFSFPTPEGLCKISFFDLMFLSKFIDVGGRISNVPDLNIVQINTYLYNNNLNCASLKWFKEFIPNYAQVLKDRTNW